MDIQAYEKIYKELTKLLIENHLSWVVDQFTEELSRGIIEPQPIKVKTFEEIPLDRKKNTSDHFVLKQSGHTASFLTVREHTPKERVLLLIQAFKRATCDITMMTNEVFVLLNTDNQQVEVIRFADESTQETLVVEREQVSSRIEGAKKMTKILADLYEVVENGD